MSNTSATGGYLRQVTGPLEGQALLDVFQALIVGITGLTGSLVRPAYQANPPDWPAIGTDWCAFYISDSDQDYSAKQMEQADAQTTLHEDEKISLGVVFYGPNAHGYAGQLKTGLQIAQNREAIAAAGVVWNDASPVKAAYELINNQYYSGFRVTLNFTRENERVYGVLPARTVGVEIYADDAHDTPLERTINAEDTTWQYLVSVSPFKFNDVAYTEAFVLILKDADGNWTLTELKPPSGVHAPTMVAAITAATGSINVFLTHDLNPEDPDVYYTVLSNATWAEVDAQYPGLMELEASGLSAFTFNGSDYAFVMPDGWAVADDTENDTWNRPPTITKELVNP